MTIRLKTRKISILTIALLATTLCTTMLLVPASTHIPSINIPTYAFCSISPNPVGVGQTVNVNFWINQPPPTASATYGDRWQNMTIIVTRPDGTTEKLGPFTSDATGGSYTTYTPTTVGNYSFQMVFGGQILANNNPAPGGSMFGPNPFIGDYFQPSESNVFKLTVQEEPIAYPAQNPLPTEYWTRPIYAENNNWYEIAGNWLGLGVSTFANTGMYNASGNYNPYTTAPNAPHILWTKPIAFGGTIGGEFGGDETGNYYSTSQYEPKFAPIIMNGILYYTNYPGTSANPAGWTAVNLHTGQTIWTKDTTEILRCGQILHMVTPNQYGGLAYLWSIPAEAAGFSLFGGTSSLEMWDAMTGNYILKIVNAPIMTLTADDGGNLVGYYTNITDNTLNMWNSTRCINLGGSTGAFGESIPVADSWSWRPRQDAIVNFSFGIQWTKPLANQVNGNAIAGFAGLMNGMTGLSIYATSSDVILMTASDVGFSAMGYQRGWQIEAGYSAITGEQLWIVNRTLAPYSLLNANPQVWTGTGSGVYTTVTLSTLSVSGFSLTTGKQLWGPTALPNASPFDSLGVNTVAANGTVYFYCYGGDVYAFDLLTGHLNWEYHTPSGGYESPYGSEPLWTFTVGTVADGKLFVPEGHMYSPPLFHDAQQLALNITDGSVVWGIDAFDVTSAPAIVDGVMVTLNAYDNQLYAYGKGASRTTVGVQPFGSDVVISGTVTDISAGANQEAPAANFPNGLPCISDSNMKEWMEYVYMQQQRPTNATGVPVTLFVLDANGNYRNIGTATSDSNGKFALTWKPDIPGDFTVYASFDGSESYYGSSDEAFFTASAPTPTATPVPTQAPSMADLYFVPATAGLFIAIVVVIVLMLMVLRKRP